MEAMELSNDRNLDDMEVTGIFNESRRHVIGGEGTCDAVQSCKREIDCQVATQRRS